MTPKSCLIVTAAALALAACGGGNKETAQGSAGGEILPGSASDAMLPLDTVRSQPPLAPKSEASPGAKSVAKRAAGARDEGPAESTETNAAEPAAPAEAPEEE